MGKGLQIFRSIALAAPAALLASVAWAQSTLPGNSTTGEALWNANGCSGCHTLTKARGDITARAPAGMSFDKALAALNAALSGTDLDNNATGMQSFAPSLNATNRNDIAAYIAGLAGPAPIISYTPTGGAMFTATAVGASSNATVTIRNTGTAPLTFATNNAVTIATGGDATDFRIASATCNPGSTLAANSGSCTITATFTPAAGASLTRTASIGHRNDDQHLAGADAGFRFRSGSSGAADRVSQSTQFGRGWRTAVGSRHPGTGVPSLRTATARRRSALRR